jgi:hypothetical protein
MESIPSSGWRVGCLLGKLYNDDANSSQPQMEGVHWKTFIQITRVINHSSIGWQKSTSMNSIS